MGNGIDKAVVAVYVYRLFTSESQPEQVIEAGEMVHMPMTDENVGDA